MERFRDFIITLSEKEVREIEPIIERINGLKELLLIVTDERMHDKIIDEIISLESQRDTWWKKVSSQNCKEDYFTCEWGIDFSSNKIWVIL